MRNFLGTCLVALMALPLLVVHPAHAQQAGTITGRVTDVDTGAPIANARIEAVTAGGQVGASALSNEGGQYMLSDVAAGTYSLVVWLIGYESQEIEGIRVVAGQTTMRA